MIFLALLLFFTHNRLVDILLFTFATCCRTWCISCDFPSEPIGIGYNITIERRIYLKDLRTLVRLGFEESLRFFQSARTTSSTRCSIFLLHKSKALGVSWHGVWLARMMTMTMMTVMMWRRFILRNLSAISSTRVGRIVVPVEIILYDNSIWRGRFVVWSIGNTKLVEDAGIVAKGKNLWKDKYCILFAS